MFKWFRKDKSAPPQATPPAPTAVESIPDAGAEHLSPAAVPRLIESQPEVSAAPVAAADFGWDQVDELMAAAAGDAATVAVEAPVALEPGMPAAAVVPASEVVQSTVADVVETAPAVAEVAPASADVAVAATPELPVAANEVAVSAPVASGPAVIAAVPVAPIEQPAAADNAADTLPDPVLPSEQPRARSLRERLTATARALTSSLGNLFKRNPKLDEDLLEELETALIQADIGVLASSELVEQMRKRMNKREFANADALLSALRQSLRALIADYALPLHIPAAPRPFVILTVGVNGAGKTTTIGKLAMRYKLAGHSVMLAAGDTFRAAAVEQLKTWGDRNQVPVISQGTGADSASVIFDALQAAKSRGVDVLIADTAGRLHTQGHLMQELAKVKRVLGKLDTSAPHETLLVIDGGTGQNALNQAKQFHQSVGVTGVVVTKLDGTAKGGMVFALCRELKLPLRFIGVGEKREDLREFVADEFVDALLPRELGS
jgi:fused signal recognition particle receptor